MSKFLIAIQWNGRIGDTFYFLNGYVEFENMRKLPLKIKMFFAIVSISKLFTVRILTFEYLSISMRSWLERVSESLDFNPSRSKNPLVCLSFTSVSFKTVFFVLKFMNYCWHGRNSFRTGLIPSTKWSSKWKLGPYQLCIK